MQTSLGKNTGCPAAAVPITAPTSVGFGASRLEARSPGRPGLLRASLAFGAAVRLGLLPHTASRRQDWRLTTALSACRCLRLAVATNSPREGLSPPIQCPCQAHLPTPCPATGIDGMERSAIHLSAPKRCSDQTDHLCVGPALQQDRPMVLKVTLIYPDSSGSRKNRLPNHFRRILLAA